MMEVQPTDQRGRKATGIGRNVNEAVAGAASDTFARWLHRLNCGKGVYSFAARYLVSYAPWIEPVKR